MTRPRSADLPVAPLASASLSTSPSLPQAPLQRVETSFELACVSSERLDSDGLQPELVVPREMRELPKFALGVGCQDCDVFREGLRVAIGQAPEHSALKLLYVEQRVSVRDEQQSSLIQSLPLSG